MLSEQQEIIKMNKIRTVVDCFLINKNISIQQVSNKTKIPFSSVQRYLNDYENIVKIYGTQANEIIFKIRLKLKNNKLEGNKQGGINYSSNNEATKDSLGHFTGSKKK